MTSTRQDERMGQGLKTGIRQKSVPTGSGPLLVRQPTGSTLPRRPPPRCRLSTLPGFGHVPSIGATLSRWLPLRGRLCTVSNCAARCSLNLRALGGVLQATCCRKLVPACLYQPATACLCNTTRLQRACVRVLSAAIAGPIPCALKPLPRLCLPTTAALCNRFPCESCVTKRHSRERPVNNM